MQNGMIAFQRIGPCGFLILGIFGPEEFDDEIELFREEGSIVEFDFVLLSDISELRKDRCIFRSNRKTWWP